jgi:hypothetical protein
LPLLHRLDSRVGELCDSGDELDVVRPAMTAGKTEERISLRNAIAVSKLKG